LQHVNLQCAVPTPMSGQSNFSHALPKALKAFPSSTLNSDNTATRYCAAIHAACVFPKEANMANGTVKWFNAQKGFDFIAHSGGGKDVFVHISAVERAGLSALNEGQALSFDVVNERGKDAAANLKIV
jgi:cold shock protein